MHSLSYGATTHIGRVRNGNEDSYVALPEIGLWLVADGMGGQEAGEVASAIAAYTICEEVKRDASLEHAISKAHEAIRETAELDTGSAGMGTTVVALLSQGSNYQLAWVGDSRAYLWDLRRLRRLTRDHSMVQELVDAGAITEEQAENHPQRNIITQSVGVPIEEGPIIETITGTWAAGQSILLCSDGLTTELPDKKIRDILADTVSPQDSARQLMRTALARGGHDNVTVLLIQGPRPRFYTAALQRLKALFGA